MLPQETGDWPCDEEALAMTQRRERRGPALVATLKVPGSGVSGSIGIYRVYAGCHAPMPRTNDLNSGPEPLSRAGEKFGG